MNTDAYVDFSSLATLKYEAQSGSASTLRQVAGQFESLFAHMLFKSMRSASLGDGLFDSKESKFFRDMFDQQLSVELTKGRGLGLAELMVRQLKHVVRQSPPAQVGSGAIAQSARDFVQKLLPMAKKAAESIKTDPKALLAQAALETGWGKKVIEQSTGDSSFNLFGIKADRSWHGEKVAIQTLEVLDGTPTKIMAPFRVYKNIEHAFSDYANFLKTNPRYADALGQSSPKKFVQALHQAGYATDPKYSDKIISILDSEEFAHALKDF